jgi:hypothetical protein
MGLKTEKVKALVTKQETMMQEQESLAIQAQDDDVENATERIADGLSTLRELVNDSALGPTALTGVWAALKSAEKVLNDEKAGLLKVMKPRIVKYLEENGTKDADSETSTLKSIVGGQLLKMNRNGGGYDGDKVAGILLQMGKKPESYLVKHVTFTVPKEDTEDYQKLKLLLGDQLNECKKPEGWSVFAPTPVKEVK